MDAMHLGPLHVGSSGLGPMQKCPCGICQMQMCAPELIWDALENQSPRPLRPRQLNIPPADERQRVAVGSFVSAATDLPWKSGCSGGALPVMTFLQSGTSILGANDDDDDAVHFTMHLPKTPSVL